jgi:colanic acid/amylovoran biosynthesis glycosyltransferase
MRLVALLDHAPTPTETFVTSELAALRRAGHEVRVEMRTRDDGRGRRWRALAWLVVRHPRRCLADLRARRRWRREEWVPPLRELAPAARRLVEGGEEHVHVHFAAGAALEALRLHRILGVPYSVTAHAFDVFLTPLNLKEKLESAAVASTGCAYNAQHLRRIAPAANVVEIVMGVDPERFARRGPLPGGRTVVAVGRIVPKKGFATLVDAARLLPDVRVRIAGDGPGREALAAVAPPNVELVGPVEHDAVRDLLEQADLLAMPCVVAADGDRDSMPVVVKEAMAMERLVAASDEVGLPECVLPPWGRLAPPGDAAALARAIDALLAIDSEHRAAAGAAARAWVLQHANPDVEAGRLIDAIERTRAITPPERLIAPAITGDSTR